MMHIFSAHPIMMSSITKVRKEGLPVILISNLQYLVLRPTFFFWGPVEPRFSGARTQQVHSRSFLSLVQHTHTI